MSAPSPSLPTAKLHEAVDQQVGDEKALAKTRLSGLVGMFVSLNSAYGWKLLAMLIFAQWIMKGFVWGFALSSMDFLLREYAVTGPKMQVYKAVAMLPWTMKPLFGLMSDALPIHGYRKAPYIIIVSVIAIAAHSAIGFSTEGTFPVRIVVLCLVLGCLQVSVVDLLSEARYAEEMRRRPEFGPDLMTFVWGGITAGSLIATGCVGFAIEHLGPSRVYALIAIPAGFIVLPTVLNWLEEERMGPEQVAEHRAKIARQRELLTLVLVTGCVSLTLVFVGLVQDSVWMNLGTALSLSAIVLVGFLLLLRPVISLMNCFFFVQTCCALDISGATFYFFTDTPEEYPAGPHFSKIFFASVIGVSVALLNLLGMGIYNRYMKTWRYHSLLIFANLLQCGISLLGLLVYARINVRWGISDRLFVLATSGAGGMVHTWMWLPGIVLMSHLCPKGVEATMYALLAGCHNLGMSVAAYSGAALLQVLGVNPSGQPQEQAQFDNLWIAAVVSAILPVLTLAMLPWMIPNAMQTERLLDEDVSAVAGSPWQRFRGTVEEQKRTKSADASYGSA